MKEKDKKRERGHKEREGKVQEGDRERRDGGREDKRGGGRGKGEGRRPDMKACNWTFCLALERRDCPGACHSMVKLKGIC